MRALLVAFCLVMTSCGFSPVYGSHAGKSESVEASLGKVSIANIPERDGQFLRNHLIDRLYTSGRPKQPEATLTVTLRSVKTDLGIRKDATTSRSELNMWADYVLKDRAGKELTKGTAHSVASYSKLDAQYGQLSAERNATERTLNEVGEQIVNRLSLYYAEKR